MNRSHSRSSDPGADPAGASARLVVGLVRGLHGLRGDVRVEVLTDHPEARFAPGTVMYREGAASPLTVRAAAPIQDGPGWRVAFREIADRGAAEVLRGVYLEVDVPAPAEDAGDAVYWHEVIGVPVTDLDGGELGRVSGVYRVGEADVYEVSGGPLGSFDLPAVRWIIRDFAPRDGRIVVDRSALALEVPTRERTPRPRRRHAWSRHGRGSADAAAERGTADDPPEA